MFGAWSMMGWMACIVLLATDKWLLGVCLFVLFLGIHVLVRRGGPPVILAAFTYQWLQVSIALLYLGLTGRQLREMRDIDYTPMVLISLGAVICYFGGYWIASATSSRKVRQLKEVPLVPLVFVSVSYFGAIAVSVLIQRIAWRYPGLTQLLFVLSYIRYVLLFMLITRLMRPSPQWLPIFAVLGIELIMGFTGYFATFRESLVFVGLAISGAAVNRHASTWLSYALVGILAVGAALTWTAVKPYVRAQYAENATVAERLDRVVSSIAPAIEIMDWGDQVDRLVSRMWMINFPSRAYARVPSMIPFEGGKLLKGAVLNTVMPRMFFPEKSILPSESEKVRKYADVYVAGRERGTSFAFGYTAESYVDFGLPWMFAPILIFGLLLGLGDRFMHKVLRNQDLRNGVRVVVLWSTMYLFEQSWVIMLGMSIGLYLMLVGSAAAFERIFHLAGDTPARQKRNPPFKPQQPHERRLPIAGQIQID
jgi:hypothetical protein